MFDIRAEMNHDGVTAHCQEHMAENPLDSYCAVLDEHGGHGRRKWLAGNHVSQGP